MKKGSFVAKMRLTSGWNNDKIEIGKGRLWGGDFVPSTRLCAGKRDSELLECLPEPIRVSQRYKRKAFVYLRRLCFMRFMYKDSISILPSQNKNSRACPFQCVIMVKEIPHNARGSLAGEFQPLAACKNPNYPPGNLRFLQFAID